MLMFALNRCNSKRLGKEGVIKVLCTIPSILCYNDCGRAFLHRFMRELIDIASSYLRAVILVVLGLICYHGAFTATCWTFERCGRAAILCNHIGMRKGLYGTTDG